MKRSILLIVLLAFWISKAQAQSSIIIDPALSSIYITDIPDTFITSYTTMGCVIQPVVYTLDIDGNGATDFTFSTDCFMGGMGSSEWIRLASGDSSWFSVDSSVYDTAGTFIPGQGVIYYLDTFALVKIYNLYDTLYEADCLSQNDHEFVNYYYSGFPLYITVRDLDFWISGEHYIGIRKIINGINYLGWIKVEVESHYKITVKEYALNVDLSAVTPVDEPEVLFFPNPVKDKLYINSSEKENLRLQIFNISGQCKFQSNLEVGKNEISLESLPKGLYVICLKGNNVNITKKLLKD